VRFRHVELTFGNSASADGAPPAARTEREVPSAAAALADAPRAADPGEAPASGGDREAGRFRVVLHVDGGDSLDVDTFDDEAGALAAANTLAGELADLRAWPRVGRLFIAPSRIVAIEVQEIRLHRGSAMRRRWADGDASPATGSRERFGL
jgi:plasmid stabilization system protein ParE